MGDRERRIRDEAYRIWVEDGRPDGDDQRYWYAAERAIDTHDKAMVKPPAKPAKPAAPKAAASKPAPKPAAAPKPAPLKGEAVEVLAVKPARAPRKTAAKPKAD